MEVRRARGDELAGVGDLTVAAYAGFTLGPGDPYVARLRDAAARDREAELWVAVDDDRLLGTVTYCPPGSAWRELARDGEGEFRMLAVSPGSQGRGVGAALVSLCDRRAVAHGASALVLSSLAAMRTAHRLYERHGYTRSPGRDWSPMPGVHLIAYRKELLHG